MLRSIKQIFYFISYVDFYVSFITLFTTCRICLFYFVDLKNSSTLKMMDLLVGVYYWPINEKSKTRLIMAPTRTLQNGA